MVDLYQSEETNLWIVTYQRNEHSEIETLYEGDSEEKAYEVFDKFIDDWG
jgi:hypothetical protein